jgi:hypothetical protein
MITEYFVCYGRDTKKLQEAVNQAIQNGWQPLGGVAAVLSCLWLRGNTNLIEDEKEVLYQAVVRIAGNQD